MKRKHENAVVEPHRLAARTIEILKELGVTHVTDCAEEALDALSWEIARLVPDDETIPMPPEQKKRLDECEDALDDVNNFVDSGLDYDWINEQLKK